MPTDFKWFSPKLGTPIVSVAEYGITFNKAAAEEMGNPERIQLGFNTEMKLIGVKPLKEYDEELEKESFSFAEKERKGFIRINNKDFIRFISRYCPEINFSKAVRCLATMDEEQNVLIVDLSNPLEGQVEE